jgi:ribosome biogenesis protein ENP2
VTAIQFSPDGLSLAAGNKEGKVYLYDLRYPVPLFNIKHSYKLPIKKIKFHNFSNNIITIDKKIAKYSNMKTGKGYTNIETKTEINDYDCYENSGLSFVKQLLK